MNAYPLSWPEGWPRLANYYRVEAKFGKRVSSGPNNWKRLDELTITEGVQRVLGELQTLGIDRQDVIISTNVRTRLDGLPRSGERAPEDPGASVYWEERSGNRRVIAVDRYTRVADNLAAIAATLEAFRAVERHGGARVLERAFTGFTALPAPGQTTKRTWHQVFGLQPTDKPSRGVLAELYRRLARQHHPDRGGSHALMAELNIAYDEAKKEIA